VGQDEDPLPLVWRTAFRRAEYSKRRLVTKLFQFSNDFSESEADMTFDVLKEADPRSENSNSVCDVGPEVTRIFCSKPLSCG
jgi:hypothetical protein